MCLLLLIPNRPDLIFGAFDGGGNMLIVWIRQRAMQHEERVCFINCRGQALVGILHHPAEKRAPAAVILCHGMESTKESEKLMAISRTLAEKGVRALRFDFACSGESGGKFEEITYSGEVEDLQAAFDFLCPHQAERIGLLGSSMGGTVALLLAARDSRAKALVTIAAPIHPEKITESLLSQEEVLHWRQTGFLIYHGRRINVSFLDDVQRLNISQAARTISCPVLVIHGDRDTTVPVDEAYELYGDLPRPKKLCILRGADHRLAEPRFMEEALRESVDWLVQNLL